MTGIVRSTSSGGNGLRVVPSRPGWPPDLRPVGFCLRRCFHGTSDDGGFEEFDESWFSRAVSSRTFSWRMATCCFRRLFSRVRLARVASRWHRRRSLASNLRSAISSLRSVVSKRASSRSKRSSRESRLPTPCQSVDSSAKIRGERLRLRVSVHPPGTSSRVSMMFLRILAC